MVGGLFFGEFYSYRFCRLCYAGLSCKIKQGVGMGRRRNTFAAEELTKAGVAMPPMITIGDSSRTLVVC